MPRIPRGVPSITYCRVLNSVNTIGQGDVISDGNSITVLEPGQTSTRHEVAQVLEKGISDEQVCELTMGTAAGSGIGTSLNPIAAFVNDAVTSVIFIVGSKQTKKWHFIKKTVLPFIANEMFSHVTEKDQHLASHYYKAQVNFSAFEIQDEIITDLVRPVNRGLQLSVTAEEGTVVAGIHRETISDEMELRRLLADACDNRATHVLPVGGSIDTSTAVYEFTLYQSEGSFSAHSENVKECTSRLILVDVPSTDPLVTGGAIDVRALEGPTLHKSLLTFHEVIKKLSTPQKAAVAPFRQSKLTHFLNELLGGNSIVVGLGLLASGEPQVSRKTLEVMGALNTAVHYPLGGKELTDTLQGLLAKYRATVLSMQDDLTAKESATQSVMNSEHAIEKQLIDLQKDLATAILDKNEAVSDRERIFEMTELLKAKYTTLMNDKLQQSEELAQSEEDKITIAKALMEQKLEYNKLQEESEAEKYQLNVELTTAKATIEQLESTVLSLEVDKDALNKTITELNTDKEVLRGEISVLNGEISVKDEQIAAEKDKNLELGAELLTLVNRRDLLQSEVDNFTTKYNLLSDEKLEKVKENEQLQEQLARAIADGKVLEAELFEAKRLGAETDIENKRIKLVLDTYELEQREKKMRRGSVSSVNGEAGQTTQKFEELQAANKKYSRLVKELEKNLKRTQTDLQETINEKAAVAAELNDVREKYRSKLSSLLLHDNEADMAAYKHYTKEAASGSFKGRKQFTLSRHSSVSPSHPGHEESALTSKDDTGKHSGRRESSAVVSARKGSTLHGGDAHSTAPIVHTVSNTAALQQQLIDSYTLREKMNAAQLDASLAQKGDMKSAYRTLYDKYRATLENVEEHLPKAGSVKVKALEEQLVFGEQALAEADAVMDEFEAQERKAVADRIQRAEQAGLQESERMSFILATYQRNLEVSESKLAAAQQENIDLHIQINQLVKQGGMNGKADKNDSHLAPPAKSTSPVTVQQPTPNATTTAAEELRDSKQLQMYETLTNEIKELKSQLLSGNLFRNNAAGALQDDPEKTLSAPETTAPAVLMKQPTPPVTPQKKSDNQKAESTSDGLHSARRRRSSFKPVDDDTAAVIEEYKAYIKQLESDASGAMSSHLRIAESRALSLSTANAALQQELLSYQQYMRNVVPQYKKQIAFMKQQLAIALKGTPGAAVVIASTSSTDNTDLKLPQIKS